MSTTVRGNGTVHFTFSFIMKLNIIIITSCDSLFTIFIIKLENGLKKHFRNVARIKHGFVELVVILFTLNTRCDHVIPYQLSTYQLFFQNRLNPITGRLFRAFKIQAVLFGPHQKNCYGSCLLHTNHLKLGTRLLWTLEKVLTLVTGLKL